MRLIFLGDVMLGRLVNELLQEVPPEYVWGDTSPILKEAEARIINLECVISDRGEPWPGKIFTFRTDVKNIEVLKVAHINAVSLANNHALDYGAEAIIECLKILKQNSVYWAGAGRTLTEAARPATFTVGKTRVALVAFTDNEPSWEATLINPGVFYVPLDVLDRRFKQLKHLVQAVRRSNDLVIVSAHWGPNWGREPPLEHVEVAHVLIEAGADIIFVHSPHIFRGIEIFRHQPIFYSCGDFIDDYAVDEVERNDWSFIFQVDFADSSFSCQRITLVPTVIRDFQARLAKGEEQKEILRRMLLFCQNLGTAAEIAQGKLIIRVD